MADTNSPRPGGRPRMNWGSFFHDSTAAIFVVSGGRKLRYANPAWEKLTGQSLAQLRGTRFSAARQSASPLWKALAPPPEVWNGQAARVRRPVPPAETGPPWWDVTFVPLPGEDRLVGVLGVVTLVGRASPRATGYKVPAILGELRQLHANEFPFDLFDGSSAESQRLVAQARLAAQTTVPVWLVGEAGTGKETLARVIHHNGLNREQAFVGLDCQGLQPYLIESLLTGRGGLFGSGVVGTLYLKEPAALPRDLQDRIIAPFLSAKSAGFRLICGSTATAAEGVAAGRLIRPFHTALAVIELRLLPVRNRIDDLPRMADVLVGRVDSPRAQPKLADEVGPVLRSHAWPGNVRELGLVLAAAVEKAGVGAVQVEHLPRSIREVHSLASTQPPRPARSRTLDQVLELVERRLIEHALRQAGNSQTEAAERLGVFRTRLARRIEALSIPALPRPRARPGKDDETPEA